MKEVREAVAILMSIFCDCHLMYLLVCVSSQLSALDPVSNWTRWLSSETLTFLSPEGTVSTARPDA